MKDSIQITDVMLQESGEGRVAAVMLRDAGAEDANAGWWIAKTLRAEQVRQGLSSAVLARLIDPLQWDAARVDWLLGNLAGATDMSMQELMCLCDALGLAVAMRIRPVVVEANECPECGRQ